MVDSPGEKYIPSVIVALAADGSLYMEIWRNGMRQKIPMAPGEEMSAIRAELYAAREREKIRNVKTASEEAAERRRIHSKVWKQTVESHGKTFATRVITGQIPKPPKRGAKGKIDIDLSLLDKIV